MKQIDPSLLNADLQRHILAELAKRLPGGMLACEITGCCNGIQNKIYSNVRYLELNGYISINRLHSIGSSFSLENDILFVITQAGHELLCKV